jgi:archaellum component FlaF (FlaF/FlaG flagellin family)
METAFVSIICVALMVIGGMTMSQGFLSSVDTTTSNIQVLSQRDEEIMRTNIEILSATQTAADTLLVTIKNNGQTKLAVFEKWDVIVHIQDSLGERYVTWLPYDGVSPGNNEWSVQGIYMDSGGNVPEAYEPGIVNPDEEVVVISKLNPPVGVSTINLVSVSTPNGVTVSKTFSGYTP